MNYREIMSDILEEHPTLSGNGWRDGSKSEEKFQADRDWMLSEYALSQFKFACDWVSLMEPQIKINPDAHSYALKHKAERYFRTYIANGIFIAAALHFGFRFKLSGRDNPNCRFNMSSKNIKRFDKR